MKRWGWMLAVAVGTGMCGLVQAQDVDLDMTGRIRAEALQRSQVMATLDHMTDHIGPRLTNSPSMLKASEWTRGQLSSWGLANVREEMVDDLGRGWEFDNASVLMLGPRPMPLHALPKAWTPGTNGPVEGDAIYAKLESKADLEKWKGKLRGKVVFTDVLRPYKPGEQPDFHRHDEKSLEDLIAFPVPRQRSATERAEDAQKFKERMAFAPLLNQFLVDEGVLATVGISSWDNGIVRVMGGGSRKGTESDGAPAFVMIAEHYNTVMRALDRKAPVRLRLSSDAHFTTPTSGPGYNVIAEIPGTGPQKNEIVMIGAHLDSWHTGSGANDNGAGVAVMMEAMR
ncbi:MAG: M28 family peptidase, partial [Xanthomonadaceae bacterium]|nr:M28 family peptidase [Xanthomonadaceae bacterium]